MSTRRVFEVLIVGLATLACTPLCTAEETRRIPRIGVLWPALVERWNQAFHEGLRESGYVGGATVTIDVRATGANFESGPRLAEELIALDPDVIYAVPAALAKDVIDAQTRAGKQIPLVVLTGGDPVAERLVASAARPGANITGIAGVDAPGDLVTKHLQLLKEILPRLRRAACLIDTTWYRESSLQTKAALDKVGSQIGVQVSSIDVHGPGDLDRALSEVVRKRADAMIIPLTAMSLANRTRIIAFAASNRLPTVYWEEVFAQEGGLMSYGFSAAERYRRAARVVAKILQGAKAADIPVDYSSRFRFVLNLQTAKALGIRVPEPTLIQADEVIK